MNSFGIRLKTFRESTGLSQIDFAKKIGISQVNVTHWENDKNHPNSEKAMKIVKAFPQLNQDWLFTGEGQMLLKNGESNNQHLTSDSTEKEALRLRIKQLEEQNSKLTDQLIEVVKKL